MFFIIGKKWSLRVSVCILYCYSTVRIKTIDTFTLGGVAMGKVSRNASVFTSHWFLDRRELLCMLVGLLDFL